MQRLFEVGFAKKEHYPALKELWQGVFGDTRESIDHFFKNVVTDKNVICAFCNGEPVSVLYAVESNIHINGSSLRAYYIYAVCTKEEYRGNKLSQLTFSFLEKLSAERGIAYLYLVPAHKSLFKLYEALGFSVAFTFKQVAVKKSTPSRKCITAQPLTFEAYKSARERYLEAPYTEFTEEGFNAFYSYIAPSMQSFCIEGKGYAVFEKENGVVTVHESIGDRAELLSAVFSKTEAETIFVRESAKDSSEPYGMLKALNGAPLFSNGFIGVSYGG